MSTKLIMVLATTLSLAFTGAAHAQSQVVTAFDGSPSKLNPICPKPPKVAKGIKLAPVVVTDPKTSISVCQWSQVGYKNPDDERAERQAAAREERAARRAAAQAALQACVERVRADTNSYTADAILYCLANGNLPNVYGSYNTVGGYYGYGGTANGTVYGCLRDGSGCGRKPAAAVPDRRW